MIRNYSFFQKIIFQPKFFGTCHFSTLFCFFSTKNHAIAQTLHFDPSPRRLDPSCGRRSCPWHSAAAQGSVKWTSTGRTKGVKQLGFSLHPKGFPTIFHIKLGFCIFFQKKLVGAFKPIWKISVKMRIFPRVNIRRKWNHHCWWFRTPASTS